LAETSPPVLHAIGRIAGWVVEPLLLYLILAFPVGAAEQPLRSRARHGSRADRADAVLPDRPARRAHRVVIDLTDDGVLRFEVRNDGSGFDVQAGPAGLGLTTMRDRLATVAGELSIESSPENGTRVIGRIPLQAPAASPGSA
jgi:hypothetical protein